jgi:Bacterial regulatory helix-turn-helix protein, lysR family
MVFLLFLTPSTADSAQALSIHETIKRAGNILFPYRNNREEFVHVSQTQSFTKSAKRLGVPKSSVSRAVLRLENRLGVRLVERTTRRVALTEVGELYLAENYLAKHFPPEAW